jgi:hypothetical protein
MPQKETQPPPPSHETENTPPLHAQRNQINEDQMLIDETIDLVGSDDNVNRFSRSRENVNNPPTNITYELRRRDGTFIKTPTLGFDLTKTIGSVNSLPDANEAQVNAKNNVQRAVSKSRDSLNSIPNNRTRIIRLRKSREFLGSSLSLTKSPEWGSEDMLNISEDIAGNKTGKC